MHSNLQNIFDKNKFEEFLIANWTQFINSSKLLAYVLHNVKNNANTFANISSSSLPVKGVSITISRFHWINHAFIIWAEFHVPLSINSMAEGTMELSLSANGTISHIRTIGNIHSVN